MDIKLNEQELLDVSRKLNQALSYLQDLDNKLLYFTAKDTETYVKHLSHFQELTTMSKFQVSQAVSVLQRKIEPPLFG